MRKRVFTILIMVAVAAISLHFIFKNIDEFYKILEVPTWSFIALSFLFLITLMLNGLITKVLMDVCGVKLTPTEWFGLSVVNTYANYLPFHAGAIVKGIYLKKKHQLPYTIYLTTVGSTFIISFYAIGVLGLIVSAILYINFDVYNIIIITFFAAIIILPYILQLSQKYLATLDYSLFQRITNMFQAWDRIKSQNILLKLFVMSICGLFVYGIRLFVAFQVLGYVFPFLHTFAVSLIGTISHLLNITPAGLGVKEATIGFSAQLLGTNAEIGIVAATLDRVVAMLWALVLGTIFTFVLARKRRETNPLEEKLSPTELIS